MCTCSAPFYRRGAFRGAATVDVSLGDLRARLSQVDTAGGYCLIVSQAGNFVSHPKESYILDETIFRLAEQLGSEELAAAGRQMTQGNTGVYRLRDPETGEPAWLVCAPVVSVGWSLAAVIPESAVLGDVYEHVNRQAALLLGGLAAIIVLVMLMAAWITRPMARLAAAATELAQGNLEVQVPPVKGRDEIAAFAATFNKMVRDLKNTVERQIHETAARESLERELQVARRLQTALLPTARPPFPDRREFSLDAHNEPAKIMAGDFYDFWFVDEDVLALVVADVCGKGTPAAMFMAVVRTILRHFPAPGQGPAQRLTLANRILAPDNNEQMFVTVFYAHYHVRTGELLYANAGHNPPYLVRRHGALVALKSQGTILGMFDDAQFADGRDRLEPGDLLFAYTDGVTEAADAQGTLFGEERLEGLLAAVRDEPVAGIRDRVLDAVNQYRQSKDQDDVTLLVLKRST